MGTDRFFQGKAEEEEEEPTGRSHGDKTSRGGRITTEGNTKKLVQVADREEHERKTSCTSR